MAQQLAAAPAPSASQNQAALVWHRSPQKLSTEEPCAPMTTRQAPGGNSTTKEQPVGLSTRLRALWMCKPSSGTFARPVSARHGICATSESELFTASKLSLMLQSHANTSYSHPTHRCDSTPTIRHVRVPPCSRSCFNSPAQPLGTLDSGLSANQRTALHRAATGA